MASIIKKVSNNLKLKFVCSPVIDCGTKAEFLVVDEIKDLIKTFLTERRKQQEQLSNTINERNSQINEMSVILITQINENGSVSKGDSDFFEEFTNETINLEKSSLFLSQENQLISQYYILSNEIKEIYDFIESTAKNSYPKFNMGFYKHSENHFSFVTCLCPVNEYGWLISMYCKIFIRKKFLEGSEFRSIVSDIHKNPEFYHRFDIIPDDIIAQYIKDVSILYGFIKNGVLTYGYNNSDYSSLKVYKGKLEDKSTYNFEMDDFTSGNRNNLVFSYPEVKKLEEPFTIGIASKYGPETFISGFFG